MVGKGEPRGSLERGGEAGFALVEAAGEARVVGVLVVEPVDGPIEAAPAFLEEPERLGLRLATPGLLARREPLAEGPRPDQREQDRGREGGREPPSPPDRESPRPLAEPPRAGGHGVAAEPGLEVAAERAGRGVAVGGRGRERPPADRVEVGVRRDTARGKRRGVHRPGEELRARAAAPGRPPAEDLEQDRPERVDVAGLAGRLAAGLLGGHVLERPQDRPGRGATRPARGLAGLVTELVAEARDAPVEDEDVPPVLDHEVGGLQVAVEDAALVRVLHDRAGRPEGAEELRPGEAGADRLGERPARDELHRVEETAVRKAAEVVDRDDARVVELRGRPRLGVEAGRPSRRRELRGERLERDGAVEPRVVGGEDLAHAPARDRGVDPVAVADREPDRRAVARDERRQTGQHVVGEPPHGPKRSRISSSTSPSVETVSRTRASSASRSRFLTRKSQFVTSFAETPKRAASAW